MRKVLSFVLFLFVLSTPLWAQDHADQHQVDVRQEAVPPSVAADQSVPKNDAGQSGEFLLPFSLSLRTRR